MSALDHAGDVRPDYRHISKLARPAATLTLGGAALKWYDIAPAGAPVPADVHALARCSLEEASRRGALGLAGDLGFVILHRCGQSFYFLIVTTWRNDNELWETVWAKDGDADLRFRPWPAEGSHRPTFCVWELGAVCHERRAWSDYLRSQRGEAARRDYLRAWFEGEV